MQVTVNGAGREVAPETTVGELLRTLGLKAEATVVQLNADVLERSRFDATRLSQGDTLELVRFVGGG